MRRLPWILVALALSLAAWAAFPRAETYAAQTPETTGGKAGTATFPWPAVVLGVSAAVCFAVGFRPRSAAVQRALGPGFDIHEQAARVLSLLRRK